MKTEHRGGGGNPSTPTFNHTSHGGFFTNFGNFPVVRGYSRDEGIAQFLGFQRSVVTPCKDYAQVRYPAGIADLIDVVVGTSEADANLVALACLGAIAAADQGVHRVLYPNGEGMPLSFFALAGAEPGYGKSTAFKPFLGAFREYEELNCDEWKRDSARSKVVSTVKSQQVETLCKQMARKGDLTQVDEVVGLLLEAKKIHIVPRLLCDDFNSASVNVLMDSQGYVIRLSPDAESLDFDVYRQMSKYWSGEGHTQERISRPSSRAIDPFVVNVAFTQPRYFQKFVQNRDAKDMGLLARTFMLCPSICTPQPRPVSVITKDTAGVVSQKLHSLLDYAFEHSPRNGDAHRSLRLSPEAVELWEQYSLNCKREAQAPSYHYRDIGGWFSRAPEHALRVAAIFQLAGDDCHTNDVIDVKTLGSSIQFAETGIEQARASIVADASDLQIYCAHAICEWICNNCMLIFECALLKMDMHNKSYNAEIVDSALSWLERNGVVRKLGREREKRNGRPTGYGYRVL